MAEFAAAELRMTLSSRSKRREVFRSPLDAEVQVPRSIDIEGWQEAALRQSP